MSYSSFFGQGSMVFDANRNDLYAQAIREIVTEKSVVLDLGAGIGIFGLIAAAAGAKHVYMVEPQPIARVALDIARANKLDNRITVIEKTIENADLPEQVDVIISVFTGNMLFNEDLLPSLYYARDNYLKPGGHLIPHKAELIAAPLCAPRPYETYFQRWQKPNHQLDFSPAMRFATQEILRADHEEFESTYLSPPQTVCTLDLSTTSSTGCDETLEYTITQQGACHGILAWIRMKLSQQWLTASLDQPQVHWRPMFLPLSQPVAVQPGDTGTIKLQRFEAGYWTWSFSANSITSTQSTLFSCMDFDRQLKSMSANYRPGLAQEGKYLLRALQLMASNYSNAELADTLSKEYPMVFPTKESAMKKVRSLALRFGTNG